MSKKAVIMDELTCAACNYCDRAFPEELVPEAARKASVAPKVALSDRCLMKPAFVQTGATPYPKSSAYAHSLSSLSCHRFYQHSLPARRLFGRYVKHLPGALLCAGAMLQQ